MQIFRLLMIGSCFCQHFVLTMNRQMRRNRPVFPSCATQILVKKRDSCKSGKLPKERLAVLLIDQSQPSATCDWEIKKSAMLQQRFLQGIFHLQLLSTLIWKLKDTFTFISQAFTFHMKPTKRHWAKMCKRSRYSKKNIVIIGFVPFFKFT